jgi:ferredoxin--NADP+ reductase
MRSVDKDRGVRLRVAIVGAGPTGFYAAAQLLASADPECAVDLFERLPTPFGLVRAGVAPDHPKIKAVTKAFERTAQHERFRFLGGVHVGRDVSREQLLANYDAVVYATGAAADRRMGIAGEELAGSHASTEFVAWYNGHPDFCDLEFDLLRARRVAVIGNGNVAMDVARMLALAPEDLAVTDAADHAIDVLSRTGIEEVVILGRRGPAQAAFTTPELREMGSLKRADVLVDPADVVLDEQSAAALTSAEARRTNKDNVELLREYAGRAPTGRPIRIRFRFLLSPVELLGDDGGHVRGLRVERNRLEGGRACATGEREELPVDVVFRSIGYVGVPLPGVAFDGARGVIPNDRGRVTARDGTPLRGEYVAGWIKRGPSGVIGTNKKCAHETVEKLLADARAGRLPRSYAEGMTLSLSDVKHLVDWRGWQAIDDAERAAGEPLGRPRIKLTRWEELRRAARRNSMSVPRLPEEEIRR